jgi:hypothetical protein
MCGGGRKSSRATANPIVTKATKEFVDQTGRRKVKGNMDIELAVDAMEIAPHIDHMVLFSGDGDFRSPAAQPHRPACRSRRRVRRRLADKDIFWRSAFAISRPVRYPHANNSMRAAAPPSQYRVTRPREK